MHKKLALRAGVLLAWLTLLVWIALASLQPPSPRPVTAPPQWFSAERALVHVDALAARPHPLGTYAHTLARDYLVSQLRRMGLTPRVQTVPVVSLRASRPYRAATVSNVWVCLPGRKATGTLLLASHYDSVPTGPGASDDAASAAAMLETLRALQTTSGSEVRLRNDLVLLWTDAEEAGLMGAQAFVSSRHSVTVFPNEKRPSNIKPLPQSWGLEEQPLKTPVIALNFEARGVSGPSLMFETSPQNGWLVRQFLCATPNPTASSLFYAVYKILPNDTDFTEFRASGMQGLNFAYIDKVSHYHTALDSVTRLDKGSLQHQGDTMLALTRHLGDTPFTTSTQSDSLVAAPDVIYFNYARSALVCYPEAWAISLALLATLLTACFFVVGLQTGYFTWRALVISGAAIPVLLLLVAGGTTLLSRLFVVLAPAPRSLLYLDNSVLTGVILFSLALAWGGLTCISQRGKEQASEVKVDNTADDNPKGSLQGRPTRENAQWRTRGTAEQNREHVFGSPHGVAAGATLWWLLLTWLTAWKLPGGSYLFVWPLLFVLVVNLTVPLLRRGTPIALHTSPQRPPQFASPQEPPFTSCQENVQSNNQSDFHFAIQSNVYFVGLLVNAVPLALLILPTQRLLFSALSHSALPLIAMLTVLLVALAFPHFTLLAWLVPASPGYSIASRSASRVAFLVLPLLLLCVSLLLLGSGLTVMRPTHDHPQADSLFYALDADRGQALWASDDHKVDAWTRQFLGDKPMRSNLPDFLPGSGGLFLHTSAPVAPLLPPTVTLEGEHTEGNIRTLRLHVTSSRRAPLLEIAAPTADVIDATVENVAVSGNGGHSSVWSLLYLNVPAEGLTLSLRIRSKQDTLGQGKETLLLRVIDRSYGLPIIPGKPYLPRPATFIAAPANAWYQDTALVSKTFRL